MSNKPKSKLISTFFLALSIFATSAWSESTQQFQAPTQNTTHQANSPVFSGNGNTFQQQNIKIINVRGKELQYIPYIQAGHRAATRPISRKLAVTGAYILPNYNFFADYPWNHDLKDVAFLFIKLRSLSPQPILITSADFSIYRASGITQSGTAFGNNVIQPETGDHSVLLQPGGTVEFQFSKGILLKGLSQHMDSVTKDKEHVFYDWKPPRINNQNAVTEFNRLLGHLFGQDAYLVISIYENDHQLIHQVRFPISDGGNLAIQGEHIEKVWEKTKNKHVAKYEYFSKLQYDAFLGEYIRLLKVFEKAPKPKMATPIKNLQ